MVAETATTLTEWEAIEGMWKFEDSLATYLGPVAPNSPVQHGLALSPLKIRSGSISTTISFDETQVSAGRIVFGYNYETGAYFSAGIGGYDRAYVLDEFLPTRGWQAVKAAGSNQNLAPQSSYKVEIEIRGQNVQLIVNNVPVLKDSLPYPPTGDQIGLFGWGPGNIGFKGTSGIGTRPKAFVVMQFGEPYDSLYSEVIRPVSEANGLEAYRADDVYKPGIILQDIIRGILEAEVIVAEITPLNANVFYEIGYAHALGKPTILLAERGRQLPFDIHSYRCIFYDNSIKGKNEVETYLRQHLRNILQQD